MFEFALMSLKYGTIVQVYLSHLSFADGLFFFRSFPLFWTTIRIPKNSGIIVEIVL
jgi:hypothetical protein